MERDTSEREALKRKAQEERAALKHTFEDEDGVHVNGRPKFAPPVRVCKTSFFDLTKD